MWVFEADGCRAVLLHLFHSPLAHHEPLSSLVFVFFLFFRISVLSMHCFVCRLPCVFLVQLIVSMYDISMIADDRPLDPAMFAAPKTPGSGLPKSPQPVTPATQHAMPAALSAAATAAAAAAAAAAAIPAAPSMANHGVLPLLDAVIRANGTAASASSDASSSLAHMVARAAPAASVQPLVTFTSETGPAVTLPSATDMDTSESATDVQLPSASLLAQAATTNPVAVD